MPAENPPRLRRWLWRGVVTLSLGLNLLVLGALAGAGWSRGGWPLSPAPELHPAIYLAALEAPDRDAIRAEWRARGPDMRQIRAERRAALADLAGALRAQPHDPAALETALAAMDRRLGERQALARTLLVERVEAMTAEDRAAFADRLEASAQESRRATRPYQPRNRGSE